MNKAMINYILFALCVAILIYDVYEAVYHEQYVNLIMFAVMVCASQLVMKLKR